MNTLPTSLADLASATKIVDLVEPARGNEPALRALLAQDDQTMSSIFREGFGLQRLKEGGPGGSYKPGPSLYGRLTPDFIAHAIGRLRVVDELDRIAGRFSTGATPPEVAIGLGSLEYNQSESGAPAFGVTVNAWLDRYYRMRYAPGYSYTTTVDEGGQQSGPISVPPRPIGRQWTSEGLALLSTVRPGHMEEDIIRLMGGPSEAFGRFFTEPAYYGPPRAMLTDESSKALFDYLGIGTGKLGVPGAPGMLIRRERGLLSRTNR